MDRMYAVEFTWNNGLYPQPHIGDLTLHAAFVGAPTGEGVWTAGGRWSFRPSRVARPDSPYMYGEKLQVAPEFWQENQTGIYFWEGGRDVVLTATDGDKVWRAATMHEVVRERIFQNLKDYSEAKEILQQKYRLHPKQYDVYKQSWAYEFLRLNGWFKFTGDRRAERKWTLTGVE